MFTNSRIVYREVLLPRKKQVSLIVFLQLTAQICLLASFILPWQLLGILSSGHSRIADKLHVDEVLSPMASLFFFATLIIFSFLTYLWLNYYIDKSIESLSNRVINDLGKTKLMNNYLQVGHQTMSVIIRSLSATFNCAVFILFCWIIYPKVSFSIGIYMLVLGVVTYKRYHYLKPQQKEMTLQQFLIKHGLLLSNGALVIAFLVIAFDYYHQQLPNFFNVFMSILILRQAVSAFINMLVSNMGIINRQKNIDLLFLPRSEKMSVSQVSIFEQKFFTNELMLWLPDFLNEYLKTEDNIAYVKTTSCRFADGLSMVYLIVNVKFEVNQKTYEKNILLKCYPPSRQALYQHEINLLWEYESMEELQKREKKCLYHLTNSPIPRIHNSAKLDWMSCALFFFPENTNWTNGASNREALQLLRTQLFSLPLLTKLIEQYEQTHEILVDRMKQVNWLQLDYLTEQEKINYQLPVLIEFWDDFIDAIALLPVTISSELLPQKRLVLLEEQPIIYGWQAWVYDTLGSRWGVSGKLAEEVTILINNLAEISQPQIIDFIQQYDKEKLVANVVLAAKIHEFCRRLNVKDDVGALDMIEKIVAEYP